MLNAEVEEVNFEKALGISKANNSKFIWLGSEPSSYISELLNLENKDVKAINPEDIIYSDKKPATELEGAILVCYHGRTSKFVAGFLKKKHGVNTYSLKDGITGVVGEIL